MGVKAFVFHLLERNPNQSQWEYQSMCVLDCSISLSMMQGSIKRNCVLFFGRFSYEGGLGWVPVYRERSEIVGFVVS